MSDLETKRPTEVSWLDGSFALGPREGKGLGVSAGAVAL